jgi:hypothetical protein
VTPARGPGRSGVGSGDLPDAGTRSGADTEGMSAATEHRTTDRLTGRARHLRAQAATTHPVLAEAYRRRAAELDLQAWLEAVWNPPAETLPTDGPEGTPAPTPTDLHHLAA